MERSPAQQIIIVFSRKNIFTSIAGLAIAVTVLLFIPLIAMQFTGEVAWTLFDFMIAGILLFGIGLTYMLIARKSESVSFKIAAGFALCTGLLLIWVNMAVGIIGPENNPFNLLYYGVIAAGIICAFIDRFQPKGMSISLFVMAIAMGLVTIIALFTGMHRVSGSSVIEVLGVNGFFVMLFTISALLFRYAVILPKIKTID